jgi:Holliday junction DNA helicase RuvA
VIGFIRGILMSKLPPKVLVDVHGVGYEIDTPMSTFFKLPDIGVELTLLTHLAVREDQHTLYGFSSDTERALFRELIKVNGVGAKMALGILSAISVDDFSRCVHEEDTGTLCKVPGVGRKTAERLILDMRDRLDGLGDGAVFVPQGSAVLPSGGSNEAFHALVSLGYKSAEARKMLNAVPEDLATTEQILQAALSSAVPDAKR